MKKKSVYLIPYDFTEVSESALRLGLDLAKYNDGNVMLLHVLKKASEKQKVKLEFNQVLSNFSKEDQARIDYRVIVGDLFEDINKAGELLDVELIVMGTHGAKGFQKVFGSNAIKMIGSSSSPFLITQGKKEVTKIKTIVMPFSFDKRSIQVATIVSKVAKEFDATIHLVGFHDKDEWIDKTISNNAKIVKGHFDKIGVKNIITNIDAGNYESGLLEYAQKVDADLMAAAYFQGSIIKNPKSFIQLMIENKLHLPLLTINAEGLTVSKGAIMFHI